MVSLMLMVYLVDAGMSQFSICLRSLRSQYVSSNHLFKVPARASFLLTLPAAPFALALSSDESLPNRSDFSLNKFDARTTEQRLLLLLHFERDEFFALIFLLAF